MRARTNICTPTWCNSSKHPSLSNKFCPNALIATCAELPQPSRTASSPEAGACTLPSLYRATTNHLIRCVVPPTGPAGPTVSRVHQLVYGLNAHRDSIKGSAEWVLQHGPQAPPTLHHFLKGLVLEISTAVDRFHSGDPNKALHALYVLSDLVYHDTSSGFIMMGGPLALTIFLLVSAHVACWPAALPSSGDILAGVAPLLVRLNNTGDQRTTEAAAGLVPLWQSWGALRPSDADRLLALLQKPLAQPLGPPAHVSYPPAPQSAPPLPMHPSNPITSEPPPRHSQGPHNNLDVGGHNGPSPAPSSTVAESCEYWDHRQRDANTRNQGWDGDRNSQVGIRDREPWAPLAMDGADAPVHSRPRSMATPRPRRRTAEELAKAREVLEAVRPSWLPGMRSRFHVPYAPLSADDVPSRPPYEPALGTDPGQVGNMSRELVDSVRDFYGFYLSCRIASLSSLDRPSRSGGTALPPGGSGKA
eukprot:gene3801-704_t